MRDEAHATAPPPSPIKSAVSHEVDPARAAAEIAEALRDERIAFLLVFPPDGLDHDALAEALTGRFAGTPVFGCTTAGQITPDGYETDAVLAIAFPKAHFRCASLLLAPLVPLSIEGIAAQARRLDAQFRRGAHRRRLALTFTDGLSKQEDMLASTLTAALPEIPVYGGSAGDGLAFAETRVLHGGRFHRDAALVLLLETDLDFAGLAFDHFLPTDRRMVVTDAVPEERLVLELNGSPARQEYARLVGCAPDALSPRVFAENPVLVRNAALYHVRAIQKVQDGDALAFLSAIDDGLLLTIGRGTEILRRLEEELDLRDANGRPPVAILGFDCFLRKLEIEGRALTEAASAILARNRVLGFNTYGEQHCGVHVNQTFVGVAFFAPVRRVMG